MSQGSVEDAGPECTIDRSEVNWKVTKHVKSSG